MIYYLTHNNLTHSTMKLLLLLLVSCTVFAQNQLCQQEFAKFKTQYNKIYSSDAEDNYRLSVFCDNFYKAQTTNLKNEQLAGITKFSDMTYAEFSYKYLNYKQPGRTVSQIVQTPSNTKLNTGSLDSFDWRDFNVVTPVKDQGQCGSCWAFSAVEEIESCYARANKTLIELSPQQIVDCDRDGSDFGCNGGDTVTAFKYVVKAGGIETEKDYPYKAFDGKCKYNKTKVAVTIKGFTYATPACFDSCDKQNEDLLLKNLVSTAPVSICVVANGDWQSYVSGVIESDCPHDYRALNHCTQLVGFSTDSKGKYWIVRNSWGTNWGVQGYINLRYGSNLCGLADEATFVTIN